MDWFKILNKGAKTAEVLIYDEIGGWGIDAGEFVKGMNALGDIEHIDLKINSPGGSIIAGNVILNYLVAHKATITATIDGWALSMASVIAMAADKIIMPENAWMMIHNPMSGARGDAKELRKLADVMDRMKVSIIKAYQRHVTDKTDEEIAEMMDEETWLDANEALEIGLAHEVIDAMEVDADDVLCNETPVPEGIYCKLTGLDPENPLKNEFACVLTDKDKYDKMSRVTRRSASKNNKVYSVIRGRLKGKDEWEDHSFRYPKSAWTEKDAKSHCVEHDGKFETPSGNGDNCGLRLFVNDNTTGTGNGDALEIKDGHGNVLFSVGNQTINPNQGGQAMRFDEHGNLVDAEGNIVLTAEQIAAGKRVEGETAEAKHANELLEARKAASLEGARLEGVRRDEITAVCVSLKLDNDFRDKLIKDGTTIEAAREQAIAKHAETLQDATSVQVGADEKDKMRDGLVNCLMVRAGVEKDKEKVAEARGSEFNGCGPNMMVRAILAKNGMDKAYQMSDAAIGAAYIGVLNRNHGFMPMDAMSANTEDLLSVVSTSMNKTFLKAWEEVPTTYGPFVSTGTGKNLKELQFYKLSHAPDVLQVPEGQPVKLANLADARETTTLQKWGRGWSITEEMIINDDMNAIMIWPTRFGAAIPREINFQFWSVMLTGNGPTLTEDNLSLFNAAHGNLVAVGAGAAVAQATIQTAYTAFRTFTIISPDGGRARTQYARVVPRLLFCGPNQEWNARRFTFNVVRPAATNEEINFFGQGDTTLTPIVEPLVDTITAAGMWGLAALPNAIDGCKLLTLSGREQPEITSAVARPTEVQGILNQIQHYFRIKFLDWRAFYKNYGS